MGSNLYMKLLPKYADVAMCSIEDKNIDVGYVSQYMNRLGVLLSRR